MSLWLALPTLVGCDLSPQGTPPPTASSLPEPVPSQSSPAQEGRSQPSAGEQKADQQGQALSLEGIIYDEQTPLAIINGEIFGRGDTVLNMEITDISAHAVTLKDPATGTMMVKELDQSGASLVPQAPQDAEASEPESAKSKASSIDRKAQLIEKSQYFLYIPGRVVQEKKYPLVVALSPDADALGMIEFWHELAEERTWIILASKTFRNGIDMQPVCQELVAIIGHLSTVYPIDTAKLIVTGFSGGAQGAHYLAYSYPRVFSAIIANTGIIHQYSKNNPLKYPRGKWVVFLASPTDFRYKEMVEDKRFLEGLGWKTKWIEFAGGHRMAPPAAYKQAAQWLAMQWY